MNIRDEIKQSGLAMRKAFRLSNSYSRELSHHIQVERLNSKYNEAMYRMWLIVLMSNLITLLTVYEVLRK